MPLGAPAAEREMQAEVGEKETTVTVTERTAAVRKVVLTRDEEGRWWVDLGRSITATTGLARSFFIDDMLGAAAGRDAEAEAELRRRDPESRAWYKEALLTRIATSLTEWADDHDGLLPPPESWLDDIESRRLWPDEIETMAGPVEEYGIALNMALAGKALPEDENERAKLVLLFECADFDRNMVGDPETELLPVGVDQPAPCVVSASGEVVPVPGGLTPSEAIEQKRWVEKCQANVAALCSALLAYARNHEGRLPAGATWCDDIELYLRKMEADADVFRCPGAPELEYGYALNAALAGTDVRMVQEPYETILILPAAAGARNEVRAVPAKVAAGRHWQEEGPKAVRAAIIGHLVRGATVRREGELYEGGGEE